MPHQEAKLDEKQVALFIEKLRARTAEDPTIGDAIIEIWADAIGESLKESSDEIAKTFCEILEPERIGGIVWMNCKVCREMLPKEAVENGADTCFSCQIKSDPGSCW